VNTADAAISGTYSVNSASKLSGPFSIIITTPDGKTVLFEASGAVLGMRLN
jgi:hypothetical protein